MGTKPTGEQQVERILSKVREIERQCRLQQGYPFDSGKLCDSLQIINNLLQLATEGRFDDFPKLPKSIILHKVIDQSGVNVGYSGSMKETATKLTSECFSDEDVFERDRTLDEWLPRKQPETPNGVYSIHELTRDATFLQMFQEMFPDREGDPVEILPRVIIKRQLTWSLPEIEDLVVRQGSGERVGLVSNSRFNFFPVESDGTVYIVSVYLEEKIWDVGLERFSTDRRWEVGSRLFLPHLPPI